jgi:hypothetical protein
LIVYLPDEHRWDHLALVISPFLAQQSFSFNLYRRFRRNNPFALGATIHLAFNTLL